MWIYLICFLVSCLLLAISSKIQNKKIKIVIVVISILIPCLLAGFRFEEIGTDVRVYVKPLYNCALKAKSFSDYLNFSWFSSWKYQNVSSYEIGFNFLVYTITKIFSSLQAVLFFIQLFTIVPVYLGICKFKELNNKRWLAMAVYYLLLFNLSLNMMRQSIGMAILFYGISCLLNNKNGKFKFFLSIVFATLFHTSSLMGIIIYISYVLINKSQKIYLIYNTDSKRIPFSNVILVILAIISAIAVFTPSILIGILKLIGLGRYGGYISGNVNFSLNKLIRILPILIIFIVIYKSYMKEFKNAYFYVLMFIFDFITAQFASASDYGVRISFIFQIYAIIGYPMLCIVSKKKSLNKILSFLLILYLLFYWYFYYVFGGANQTVPYIPFWS